MPVALQELSAEGNRCRMISKITGYIADPKTAIRRLLILVRLPMNTQGVDKTFGPFAAVFLFFLEVKARIEITQKNKIAARFFVIGIELESAVKYSLCVA